VTPAFRSLSRDRGLWGAVLIAALVVVPRAILVARAHSESFDARYHLDRGLAYLSRSVSAKGLLLNDPPLGEGLLALPVVAVNLWTGRPPFTDFNTAFYREAPGARVLGPLVAAWNAALFLPLVATAFAWCRALYGARAAWLAVGAMTIDPTFAASTAVIALDALGVAAILVTCFLLWRYVEKPTARGLLAVAFSMAVALMMKHTAVILPGVAAAMVFCSWVLGPSRRAGALRLDLIRGRIGALARLALATVGFLWALTLFDVETPPIFPPAAPPGPGSPGTAAGAVEPPARMAGLEREGRHQLKAALRLTSPWPCGLYVHSLIQAVGHGAVGQEAFLLGEKRTHGWWYYYPVVATYKVPLGILAILLLGVFSVLWVRPSWAEVSLLLPALSWSAFVMSAPVNIGFRHFLAPYAFLLMLASRSLSRPSRGAAFVAWGGLALAAAHVATYHPDYLSYVNRPIDKPYLAMSDSNVDWGQSLKQVRAWVDARPRDGRPIALGYFGQSRDGDMLAYYLGDSVRVVQVEDPRPQTGLLIVSTALLAGVYDPADTYGVFRSVRPDETIGHSMLVYDLDRLGGGKPFSWDARVAP
jgi:hypothetical protein